VPTSLNTFNHRGWSFIALLDAEAWA
jgi:hypothetical protein